MPYVPKYREMVQKITDDIGSGTLASGAKLPSTAMLCVEYGVSVTVVTQAILVLEARGLIEGVSGVGRFVK